MASFQWQRKIRFRDCDPAGIVFYPRYFEMMNDCVESFFDEAIGWSFHEMHVEQGVGVPLGKIASRFEAPSRLGETIIWQLCLTRIGRATADFSLVAVGDTDPPNVRRLHAEGTLVLVELAAMKSTSWPRTIRERLERYLEENTK